MLLVALINISCGLGSIYSFLCVKMPALCRNRDPLLFYKNSRKAHIAFGTITARQGRMLLAIFEGKFFNGQPLV